MQSPMTTKPRYHQLDSEARTRTINTLLSSSATDSQGYLTIPAFYDYAHTQEAEEASPFVNTASIAESPDRAALRDIAVSSIVTGDSTEEFNHGYNRLPVPLGAGSTTFGLNHQYRQSASLPMCSKDGRTRSTKPTIKERFCRVVNYYWLWETAACILSLLCLAIIVGVLSYEDGKQLDQWGWTIPPTAVVSFMGTLAKSSLALVLSQVLSQMKWIHFREAKSLSHLKMIDAASRGPWGALQVILYSKKILVSLVAILTVTTILVDPFIQLVFSFPSQLVEDTTQQATMQRLIYWNPRADTNYTTNGTVPEIIWSSINRGFTSEEVPLAVNCPSGNCTWSHPIKTLAVCGSCEDVTSTILVNCSSTNRNSSLTVFPRDEYLMPEMGTVKRPDLDNTNLDLSCDYTFKDSEDWSYSVRIFGRLVPGEFTGEGVHTMWLSSSWGAVMSDRSTIVQNITFEFSGSSTLDQLAKSGFQGFYNRLKNVRGAEISLRNILKFRALQIPWMNEEEMRQSVWNKRIVAPVKCSECVLHWCEKTIEQLQVINGQFPTYISTTKRLWVAHDNDDYIDPGYAGYESLNATNTSKVWKFNYFYSIPGSLDLKTAFFDSVSDTYYLTGGVNYNGATGVNLASNAGAVASLVYSTDLNQSIHRIAESLSEMFRMGQGAVDSVGQVLVTRSFIHVRWGWLALPLGLLVLTSVALVFIVVMTRRDEIALWKEDPTALLLHRIDLNRFPSGPVALSSMADEVYVRLDKDTLTFRQAMSPKDPGKA